MLERLSTAQPPHSTNHFSRRRALGTLGTGAIGLLASTSPASAFFGLGKREPVDLSSLPSGWVRRQGTLLEDYAAYLSGLRLKRLTPLQVLTAHAKRRGSVWNTLPPKRYWKNIKPTLKVIDRVARELEMPVKEVISVYRSPAYNARCRGAARGSYHQANVAVDVVFPIRSSTVASVARAMRGKGHFKGGVGRYPTFTHIDTRGYNSDW